MSLKTNGRIWEFYSPRWKEQVEKPAASLITCKFWADNFKAEFGCVDEFKFVKF